MLDDSRGVEELVVQFSTATTIADVKLLTDTEYTWVVQEMGDEPKVEHTQLGRYNEDAYICVPAPTVGELMAHLLETGMRLEVTKLNNCYDAALLPYSVGGEHFSHSDTLPDALGWLLVRALSKKQGRTRA